MELDQWIIGHEPAIRLGFFLGVLALIALWEFLAPRRSLAVSKASRWANNLGLVFLNTLLWRLHRVHHADLDYDVTTGARFHPLEIILSMIIKFATVLVLGPPVVAVVIFEVILNAAAMFNHGNLRLPTPVDRVLRWLVVTRDIHRVHHSVEDDEVNSNFGFNLPWWDRLLGTYKAQPHGGHEGMTIGIHGHRDPKQVDRLPGMLALPFVGGVSGYAINRRHWEMSPDRRANEEQ